MNRPHQLGDLQHALMRVLWDLGEATVAQVHAAQDEATPGTGKRRALTTIATMLAKMEKKGVVRHRVDGRQFVYRATVSEADVRRTMVSDLTRKLFEGDAGALVSHLLEEQHFAPDELEELRRRIAEQERLERGEAR